MTKGDRLIVLVGLIIASWAVVGLAVAYLVR